MTPSMNSQNKSLIVCLKILIFRKRKHNEWYLFSLLRILTRKIFAGCRLHIAFHGCAQTLDDINTTFVTETGYNRWAEANNIVVLYPQAKATLTNPEGCWDWYVSPLLVFFLLYSPFPPPIIIFCFGWMRI